MGEVLRSHSGHSRRVTVRIASRRGVLYVHHYRLRRNASQQNTTRRDVQPKRLKLRWVIPVWVRPPPAAPLDFADVASIITIPLAARVALRGMSSSSCPRLVHGRLRLFSEGCGVDRSSHLARHVRGDVRGDVGGVLDAAMAETLADDFPVNAPL
jgi:hypothetical protein